MIHICHHNAGLHSLVSQDKGSINCSTIKLRLAKSEHITDACVVKMKNKGTRAFIGAMVSGKLSKFIGFKWEMFM